MRTYDPLFFIVGFVAMSSTDHGAPTDNVLVNSAAEMKTEELGPFNPPEDYAFEPEFYGDPPRPIPDDLRRGRYANHQWNVIYGLFVAGGLLILCAPLPFVQKWGLYLLPLQYLGWIGLGFIVSGGLVWIAARFRRGPYRYVEEGIPLLARIRELAMVPAVILDGQAVRYRFTALIDYHHPETGELVTTEANSNDFSEMRKDELTTTFRLGDYVTAVYLPSKPEDMQLYGFLDLKPSLGLVRRDASQRNNPVMTAIGVAALVGFFGVLFWNVYAFARYAPLELGEVEYLLPAALGAVVLGGGFLAILAGSIRYERQKTEEWNESAQRSGQAIELSMSKSGIFMQGRWGNVVLFVGLLLLGGLSGLCQGFTANAWLDESKPRLRPVRITEMVMVTHNFVFREYKIKYEFLDKNPGDRETYSFLSTPAHMNRFHTDIALAEIGAGRFGWSWVTNLRPVNLKLGSGAPRGGRDVAQASGSRSDKPQVRRLPHFMASANGPACSN